MNTSDGIGELAVALSKAQGELRNPVKGSENPHFRNRYADLASGLDAIRPVLSKHGLALAQMTFIEGDMLMLDTRLIHAGSGQWLRSVYPVSRLGMKHQEGGSSMTYARRYAGFSLVGIAGADDDDDGNEAQKVDTKPAPKKVDPKRLDDVDSFKLLDAMKFSLGMCESEDSLREWVKANKAAKAQLTDDDQEEISAEYKARLAAIMQPLAAE